MEQQVTFPPEKDAFYATAKKRVNQYFWTNGITRYGNRAFFFKAVLLVAVHLAFYLTVLLSSNFWAAFICMILMGPMSILIGINIAHDAAHGSISKDKNINNGCFLLFDLLGANSYMWKNRHVFSHHLFPNILNNDADLKQNPLVRIFPDDELRSHHRFQFLYAPFLYLLYTMNWLLFRDFHDFRKKKIGSFRPGKHHRREIVKLVVFKAFYIFYIIVIPAIFSVLSLNYVLLAYVLMNCCASLLITLALIPSHVAEHSLFPLPDEKGMMPYSWSHHQVLTVIDFATNNRLLNFFFGGFNHHVTHHLFPGICHIHYREITPIIQQTALEFGLHYQHEESFINAYLSHFRLLKANGRGSLHKFSA